MNPFTTRRLPLAASIAAIVAAVPLAQAQDEEALQMEEIVVTGSLGSLPGEDVQIFGFGKSLLETPRSASTISDEQLERFNITDIDELVAFAPGTFTQSFFGVAGSLDVRGIRVRTTSAGFAASTIRVTIRSLSAPRTVSMWYVGPPRPFSVRPRSAGT
jgi:outer membrane receptor for ferrienterochelin and colicin